MDKKDNESESKEPKEQLIKLKELPVLDLSEAPNVKENENLLYILEED